MVEAVVVADAQFQNMIGQVHRVGGVAQLVIDHVDLVVGPAQADHGLDEIFAVVAVEPGRAHDDVAAAEVADILLTQQFGLAVSRDGRGLRAFIQRNAAVGRAREHIVGGDVDQPGVDLVAGQGQVARPDGIDPERRVTGRLTAVHVGDRRAVDHRIRLVAADIVDRGLPVGDVQFVHIHRDDGRLAQTLRQGAQHAAFFGQLPLELGAKLAAAARNQNLHRNPSSLSVQQLVVRHILQVHAVGRFAVA